MKCNESRTLASAFIDRNLGPMECSDFKAHVTGCGECGIYLREIEQVSGLLGSLAPAELPRELHSYVMTSVRRRAAGRLTMTQRSVDFLQTLNPQLVSYGVGVLVSTILFGMTLAGFRPIRTLGAVTAQYSPIKVIMGSDAEFHIYNDLPREANEPSGQHDYELPRVGDDSSLISFSNVAYRKPGDEGAVVLAEVLPNGKARILRVIEGPSDPEVLDDLQWSLSKRPFVPAHRYGKAVQTRMILRVQKMDVTG